MNKLLIEGKYKYCDFGKTELNHKKVYYLIMHINDNQFIPDIMELRYVIGEEGLEVAREFGARNILGMVVWKNKMKIKNFLKYVDGLVISYKLVNNND